MALYASGEDYLEAILVLQRKMGTVRSVDLGREVAGQIYERHQFFTRQLIAAGVDEKLAEEDACKIEHAISEESFRKWKAELEG